VARKVSARRYAQAVFEIALETKKIAEWQSDLEELASLAADAKVMAWLESPRVHLEDKARLLLERLKGVSHLALNLALLLVTKGRLNLLAGILSEYQRLVDSYQGIERGEVLTAIPLGEEDRRKLAEHLGAVVGKKVVLESQVAPDLLGGFVAKVGGKLLDGSVRSRLEALKREMIGIGR